MQLDQYKTVEHVALTLSEDDVHDRIEKADEESENQELELQEHELQEIVYSDLSRREMRSLIFHVLYAMECFDYDSSLEALIENFNRGFDLEIPRDCELVTVTRTIIEQRDILDANIKPLLVNWRFERLGVCTKLILRFALWELRETDTPSTIIINEAIELAKCFAEKDAYKFINGLLDEWIKSNNKDEPETHVDA